MFIKSIDTKQIFVVASRINSTKMAKLRENLKILAISLAVVMLLFDSYVPSVLAGEKGRDIIIYNGKVILKGGKKKGNIIISNGEGGHKQGSYKYKKKYMNYGGYWRR